MIRNKLIHRWHPRIEIGNDTLGKHYLELLAEEYQAVGIYEAESFWAGKYRPLLLDILKEEEQHLNFLEENLKSLFQPLPVWQKVMFQLQRVSGWGLGALASCLPRKRFIALHKNSESDAAENYQQFLVKLRKKRGYIENFKAFELLIKHIILQERKHAAQFQNLEAG